MSGKVYWGLAILALMGVSVSAAEPGVVVIRGQSPVPDAKIVQPAPVYVEGHGPLIGSAPGYGEFAKSKHKDFKAFPNYHDHNFGYNGRYYVGPEGYYSSHGKKIYTTGHGGEGCPHCQFGEACPDGGCRHCKLKNKPSHYTSYSYKWPNNMVYPQYGAPAAAVQYPYYTFRGPTDFFMK